MFLDMLVLVLDLNYYNFSSFFWATSETYLSHTMPDGPAGGLNRW